MLVSSRYERASLIVTSNKPFLGLGEIFGDEVVAAAMIDRLVHPRREPPALTVVGRWFSLRGGPVHGAGIARSPVRSRHRAPGRRDHMKEWSVNLVALNPQPLPPDASINLVALNPQPLPPDATIELVALNPQPLPPETTINLVLLNPQPLPPGVRIKLVALNPQPLPPKATIDFVALNPQPLPPNGTLDCVAVAARTAG
jgi:IstB-like ATP binding protein